MMFERYYSTGDYGYSEFTTILPFFGFKYKSDIETHDHFHGGDIKITHEYGNTYKVEKTREYETTSHSKIDTYTRSYTPSSEELRIESKFLEELSKVKIKHYRSGMFFLFIPVFRIKRIPRLRIPGLFKKPIDLLQTPYLEPTLQKYHESRGAETIFTDLLKILGKLFIAFSLLIILCHIGGPLEDIVPLDFWHSAKVQLFSAVAFAVIGCCLLAVGGAIARRFSKIPLSQTSKAYKNKLKSCYYRRMRYLYGRKLGNILKEYSILKEKNQHKI